MASQIQLLANSLSQNVELLAREIERADVKSYALDNEHAPIDLPFLGPEGSAAKIAVISAAQKILCLAAGPLSYLIGYPEKGYESGTIRALVKLGVPSLISLDKSVSYDELASKLEVSKELLERLIRFAITCGFLAEDESGFVKHNALSSVFLKDERAAEAFAFNYEVNVNASTKIYEALKLSSDGTDPSKVPLSVAFKQENHLPTLWEINGQNPTLGKGFHSLMALSSTQPEQSMEHAATSFDWNKINHLADVGGSLGHASLAIAKHFPHVRFTVQDRKEIIERGSAAVPSQFADRFSFMEHDFFQPQPVVADAYLYRFIIHDWSDSDAKRILTAALAGLRPGARLLIMDLVVPNLGTLPTSVEKSIRTLDIAMYGVLAGKERTLTQFTELVASIHPDLRYEGCSTPKGSFLSLMSWVFKG